MMSDDTNEPEYEEAAPPLPDAAVPSDEEEENPAAEEKEEDEGAAEAAAAAPSDGAAASASASADDGTGKTSFVSKAKGALVNAGKATLKAGQKLGIRAWKKSGFLSWMGRGLGTTCARTWHLRRAGFNAHATLEHDCLTGRRQLSIGKRVVYQKTVFPDRSFEIWFDINGISGKIAAENDYKDNALYYSCIFDNRPLQTTIFGAKANTGAPAAGAAAAAAATTARDVGALEVSIPEVETKSDGRLQVAFYKLNVVNESGETKTMLKRFSEFIDLYEKIWSSYASHDLLKDIPKPPKKSFKLFRKHDDPAFIEGRRIGLEKFMQGLTTIPAIMSNLFLLEFLELDTGSHEADNITIMDTVHTTLKFEAERSAKELWDVVSNWKDATWKGKGGEDVQVLDDAGNIRTFKLDKPWGEVTEKRIEMTEDDEGGTLEFIMTKSAWPLRHFSCIVSIAQKKKMVRAKILVKLKFVANPDQDVDALSEQLETHVSDQFHALQKFAS